MSYIRLGVQSAAGLGTPPTGKFYEFFDSDNLDGNGKATLTTRDDAGNDTTYLVVNFNIDLDSTLGAVTRAVAGGRTTYTVTHNLNTLDVIVQVYRVSDGRGINWRIERTGVNTVEASRAGTVTDGDFRILIK